MSDQEKIIITIDPDLEELIPEFLELTRADLASMQAALDQGDLDTLRRLGHTFKGSGAGYGFDLISEVGAKIEQLAKSGNADAVPVLVQELISYLDRVEIVYE